MRKYVTLAALLITALPAIAQLKTPRPSPKASVMQTVGLTDITIVYSRPGVKGRAIWGAVVPYDKVWRTGANEATTFAVSDDVTINGQPLAKGTYSLHTIPTKDEWTVIFNKDAGQWGSFQYDAAKDALRIKVKPQKGEFREWLTFEVPEMNSDTAKVVLRWETMAVPFTVDTGTTAKVMSSARATVAAAKPDDWQTPYTAAGFAFNSNMKDDATKWLDQSLTVNENTRNLWLKARMQAAAGDKVEAARTAQKAISKATPQDKDFVSEIEKTMATWK